MQRLLQNTHQNPSCFCHRRDNRDNRDYNRDRDNRDYNNGGQSIGGAVTNIVRDATGRHLLDDNNGRGYNNGGDNRDGDNRHDDRGWAAASCPVQAACCAHSQLLLPHCESHAQSSLWHGRCARIVERSQPRRIKAS